MLDTDLSLCQLLDPEVLANPYPLYQRLREQDPVHWDPFLHAWVVTRYPDVITVLHRFIGRSHADAGAAQRHGLLRAEPHCAGDGEADAVHGRRGAHPAADSGCRGFLHAQRRGDARAHPGDRGAPDRQLRRGAARPS